MMKRLLIIGNGMACARLLQELHADGPCGFRITVVGDEPVAAYNRILLSRLLGREIEPAALALFAPGWTEQHEVEMITGQPVCSLDPAAGIATLGDGKQLRFDKLVFATGAQPVIPDIPGIIGPQVHTFRSWHDCDVLQQYGDAGREIVIAGGGLLGIEAACGLAALGAKVTVVHSGAWPLNRQLDGTAGALLANALRQRGIHLLLSQRCAQVQRDSDGNISGVILQDGRSLRAEALVCAIGIRPCDQLAQQAGLAVDHGICVNGWMQSAVEGIHALGECARVSGENVGLMEPVNQQAAILADVLQGRSPEPWQPAATPTRLKVTGEEVFSAGIMTDPDADELVLNDPLSGAYRKLLVKEQRLIGAVLYGDTRDGNWYHNMIMEQTPVQGVRQQLLFGQVACESAA